MNAEIVGWIFTGVIGLILLSSVLWGLKRGLKKSLFRFGWLLATAILLFFITPLVSGAVNQIDISGMNLDVFGPVKTVGDVGVNIFKNIAEHMQVESNAELLNFARNVSTVVLNVILFVVLFWLLRFLLWIVWAPIAHKIFDKQAMERKKFEQEQAKKKKNNKGIDTPKEEMPLVLSVKENKHRWWGALVGLAIGLVIASCTFVPIIGVNNIYQNVYANVLYEEDGETKPYLDEVLNEQMRGYINSYENSVGSKILKYSGAGAISNFVFKNMATVKVGNETLYVESLISKGVKIYNKALVVMKFDQDNITKESLSEVFDAIKSVFTEIKDVKAIYVLADSIAPDFIKDYVNSDKFNVENEDIEKIIKNVVNDDNTDLTVSNLQNQAEYMINIAQELNNKNLIVPIMDAEEVDFDFVANLINNNVLNIDSFTNTIFENFDKITLLQQEYPRLLDTCFEMVFDNLEIDYTKQTTDGDVFSADQIQNIKNGFKTLFGRILKFLPLYINSVDFDFDAQTGSGGVMVANPERIVNYPNTINAFNYLGDILNVLRIKPSVDHPENLNLLSETNYANLLDFAKTKLTELTEDGIDVSNIINCLDEVDNWKEELNNFPLLYKAVINVVNSEAGIEVLQQEDNYLLNDIGAGLSAAVNESVLINNKNLRTIIETLLEDDEYVANIRTILDTVIEGEGITVKAKILNNIYSETLGVGTSNVGNNWENEVNCVKKVLNNFEDIEIETIGPVLDEVAVSKIFTKVIINTIIVDKIDTVINPAFGYDDEHPMPDGELKDAVNALKNNIKTKTFSYATEFGYIIGLTDTVNGTYEPDTTDPDNIIPADEVKIVAIGAKLDEICGTSVLMEKAILNSMLKQFFDEYIDSITGLDADVVTIVKHMKQNLDYVESYSTEFGYIISLTKTINATYEDDTTDPDNIIPADKVRLLTIGSKFDELRANSKLMVSEDVDVVAELVNYFFEKETESYSTGEYSDIIDAIAAKVAESSDYETLFEEITELTDAFSTFTAIDENNMEDAGATLDELANMTEACDADIAKDIADVFIQKVKESYSDPIVTAEINEILAENNYSGYDDTYSDTYFADLFTTIYNTLQ